MNKILEIKNLSKNYQTIKGEIKAIDNISFALDNEEVLCIVGSSGCGKSTLLNILAGLDTKTSGEIKIKDGCNIGYMLQDDALFPWLNILDNACLGLDIKKIKTKENIEFVKSLLIKYPNINEYIIDQVSPSKVFPQKYAPAKLAKMQIIILIFSNVKYFLLNKI